MSKNKIKYSKDLVFVVRDHSTTTIRKRNNILI